MTLIFRINKIVKIRVFWGGRYGMNQMYELKKLVTVSELWIFLPFKYQS